MLPHYLEALTWARTAAEYLSTTFKPQDFDILEYPETGGEGAKISASRNSSNPRFICRIHSGWLDAYANNILERTLLLRLQKEACDKADELVSPSAFMAGSYVKKTLGINRPVSICRNPISLWPSPVAWKTKKMIHLLYVGRVEYRKGLQVLLKALDEIGEESANIILRVVGQMHPPTRELDRQCIEYFKSRLAEKSVTSPYKIEFIGPCPHSDMAKHYDWAGIQVIPSLMENYPYVALEGLSRGCHLLGSNVGGIPEIIDRPSRGSLFPLENSTLLAQKIRECIHRGLEISDGKQAMAEEIRSEFDPENCYLRLMEAYGANLSQRVKG
jgi:glycogen synthase